jgi:hypothetical protein
MFQVDRPYLSQIDHGADLAYRLRQEAERSMDIDDVLAVAIDRLGTTEHGAFDTLLDAFKADRSMTTQERLDMASRIIDAFAGAWDDVLDLRLHGRL